MKLKKANQIGANNQRKFALNPSQTWIRIPTCTSLIILGITFNLDIGSR